MRNIFIGLLLVFLDVSIDFNTSKLGLIPDFIGYIYILKGLAELTQHSEWFTKLRPYANGMAIYSGIIYAMDLLGLSATMGIFSTLLGFVSTIVSLYISYGIVMGVRELERTYHWELNAETLLSTWKLLAICSIIVFLAVLIPVVAFIGLIVGLIANICFLYYFSQTKNRYYGQI